MGMFTKEIVGADGEKHEVLTSQAKIILAGLIGTGVLGTNAAQYLGIDKEVTEVNVVSQEDVETMMDTKIMEIQNDQHAIELQQVRLDVLEHATRDSRITYNERILQKQEKRIEMIEDNNIMQQQVLLEIRDDVKENH